MRVDRERARERGVERANRAATRVYLQIVVEFRSAVYFVSYRRLSVRLHSKNARGFLRTVASRAELRSSPRASHGFVLRICEWDEARRERVTVSSEFVLPLSHRRATHCVVTVIAVE